MNKQNYRTEHTDRVIYPHLGGRKITLTRDRPSALNLGLKIGGTLAMYGLGRLFGEGIDHIPYINGGISTVVNCVSGIDITNHIDGLIGILWGFWGLRESGIKYNKETLNPEAVQFGFIQWGI